MKKLSAAWHVPRTRAFGGMACASYARLRRLIMPLLVFGQIDGDERTCARTYARPFARPFRRHTTTGSDLAVSKYDAKSAVLRGEWHTAARGERSRACLGAKWSEVQILSPRPPTHRHAVGLLFAISKRFLGVP